MISYSKQTISQEDINSVISTLKSDWLTTGPAVKRFEKAIARFCRAKYAIAVNSGTAALHLAVKALGVERGDEVITTPYSFAATANCVLYCGGKPKFVDINEDTLNIDVEKVEKRISKKTKAIIAVDFAGLAAEWTKLRQIARKYKLKLIADAAHSFGGKYKGVPIGTQADLTCLSFHPVKTITTAEGGMVVTNSKRLADKIRLLRTHGLKKGEMWKYKMVDLGFNYRITDMQAALGFSQLKRAREYVRRRRLLANKYNQAFKDINNLKFPVEPKGYKSAWHLYPLRIDFKAIKKTREQMFKTFKAQGVNLQVHYIPIHLHEYYKKRFDHKKGDCPVAERAYAQEVSLPLYPTLTQVQQNRIIKLVKQFVKK